jgi:sialate O-acetylesterase
MIAPLIPYGIGGAIWYQGESNASRAYQYRKLFGRMIQNWRKDWGQGKFPFLFVQLANFRAVNPQPSESDWAELREAQLMTLALPNSGMAVIIDIGDANDIHPKNKQDVGKRLALWALAKSYGKELVYSGPIYKSMKIEGEKIILRFDHVGGGLVAGPDEPLKGFAIAGADRKFVWAEAKIDGDSVVVSSDEVSTPVAVRYAWADNPVCNLYNEEGLPASPFRTDDWPGITVDNK